MGLASPVLDTPSEEGVRLGSSEYENETRCDDVITAQLAKPAALHLDLNPILIRFKTAHTDRKKPLSYDLEGYLLLPRFLRE